MALRSVCGNALQKVLSLSRGDDATKACFVEDVLSFMLRDLCYSLATKQQMRFDATRDYLNGMKSIVANLGGGVNMISEGINESLLDAENAIPDIVKLIEERSIRKRKRS